MVPYILLYDVGILREILYNEYLFNADQCVHVFEADVNIYLMVKFEAHMIITWCMA